MAIVKADAYGHGARECSKRLESEGVHWFGVALPEEALEIREAGVKGRILSLGGFWPGQEDLILRESITPAIFDTDSALRLNTAAAARGIVCPVHIKVDTGMGRVGVPMDKVPAMAQALSRMANLSVEGIMTHFAAADDPAQDDYTRLQTARFDESLRIFSDHSIVPQIIDLANSPGAVAHADARRGFVRLGGILYGLGGDVLPPGIPVPDLRPVMTITSVVGLIKQVVSGETLGYGRTFRTVRDSVVATIPIGYADGLPRSLSNRGEVIIRSQKAPIVGRVSMDWIIVDVTDITGTQPGDEVVVVGQQGGLNIRAEDIAGISDTISYEITCSFGRSRIPRSFSSTEDDNSG